MAGENDDIFDDDSAGLPDGEDDLTATLREQMGKIDGDDDSDDDSGGFDAPLDDDAIATRDTVEEEEGVKRIQQAKDKASAPEKAEKKSDDDKAKGKDKKTDAEKKPEEAKEQSTANKEGEKPDATNEEGKEKSAEATTASDEEYTSAISGLPEPVRKRLEAEQNEFKSVMAPLTARQEQLKAMGVENPKDAVKWFVDVNDYAQRDTAGYAAWVINQMSGGDQEKAEKIFKDAASKLGYSVEKAKPEDDGEDDPFMTDRERELLEENRQLKAAQSDPQEQFGPDSPQEQGRRAVMEVISEVDAQGNRLRPHFETLQPMILSIIQQKVQATGQPMTAADLRDAYGQAELAHPETRDAAVERLLQEKSAAQPANDMSQQDQKNAAATEKAKAASKKIIDGPGQGAGPQPAKSDADMSIEAFLKKQMAGGS